MRSNRFIAMAAALILLPSSVAEAGLRERLERRNARNEATANNSPIVWEAERPVAPSQTTDANVRELKDVAYGTHKLQRMDVFLPANARGAPIILMVHGGGWRRGDKSMALGNATKVEHYVERQGYIYISTNYRLVPEVTPLEEADDIAAALAFVQRQAVSWGGDPDKIMLMGHSAGAHLVTLLAADPARALRAGARLWSGSIAIDSGAMNVPAIMNRRHPSLYDKAFGDDPALWIAASPYHQIKPTALPIMVICSSTRKDDPCAQGQALVEKSRSLGREAALLPQPLNHGAINSKLGLPGAYTAAVDAFIRRHMR